MKVYFPGLNGIRAIAASIVIFFHANVTMYFFGTTPIKYIEDRTEMSLHAVVMFFVLSGYLITYLLVKEKDRFKTIDIRKFYIRRILRIWPLYYFAILLAIPFIPIVFQVFHKSPAYQLETIGLYAIFIPNFALLAGYMIPTIAPLWSIGVEEQFYAFWPWLVKKSRSILAFLLIFLFAYFSLKLVLLYTGNVYSKFSIYYNYFAFDTLAIGGIAAYLYARKSKLLRILYNPVLQVACWGFFIYSCIFGPIHFHYIANKEVYAVVFAIIILNVSTNPSSVIRLNHRIFDYLGQISYGMYVLHGFVILATCIPMSYIIPHLPGKPLQLIVICSVVGPLTILSAHISYRYFESRFLSIKKKYMKVESTNRQETITFPVEVESLSPTPPAVSAS